MTKLPELWVGFAWYEDTFEGVPPCFAKGATKERVVRLLERQIRRREMIDDKWDAEYRRVQ